MTDASTATSESGDSAARRTPSDLPPWPVAVLAAVGVVLFALPVVGLAARTPWTGLWTHLSSRFVVDAAVLSVVSSIAAAAVAVLVGVPLAWVLARVSFPGRSVVRALVTLPMVLPPVVGGAALLFALGRRGVVGGPLHDATGLLLPYSIWGVILANAFVATPLVILTVEGALRNLDRRYENAAASLGASRLRTYLKVIVPGAMPELRTALLLAEIRMDTSTICAAAHASRIACFPGPTASRAGAAGWPRFRTGWPAQARCAG